MTETAPNSTATAGRPKAYNYVRFSTPEQAEGDSYRRQTEAAAAYARIHGLELDAELTYTDLGVSAFTGANARTGALAAFLEAVKDGTVPKGSHLLVENLDRITRADVLEAQELFTGIIRRGITLVTLVDQRSYSAESIIANPTDLIVAILTMMRGREESMVKSHRVKQAYERKRADAANGTERVPFTRMLPGWLRWNDKKRCHEVIKERAAILRDIFAKADKGRSKHTIARALNEAGAEPWGVGKRKGKHWHSSYIQKLMTNAAVVGTFTPHRVTKDKTGKRKRDRTPLAAIEGYFPAVIDRDVFARVSAQAKARAARGRHADAAPKSIFSGLLRCAHCEGSVVRVNKGEHAYLVCERAHQRAACRYLAAKYENAESALIERVKWLHEWAPRGHDTATIEADIEKLTREIDAGWERAREMAYIAASEKSEAARRQLRAVEEDLAGHERKLRELQVRRDRMTSTAVMRRLDAIRQALSRKPLIVAEANKALKQAVCKIVMNTEDATMTVHWHHADEPSDPIYFVSRHKRWEAPRLAGGSPRAGP
jgi:DNA invertase Pin-like site-specific DNA recombinase